MRILFFNYEYPPLGGGAANATKYILEEYSKGSAITVDLITSSLDDKLHTEKVGENITIYRIPIGKTPDTLTYQTQKELLTYTYKAYFFAKKLIRDNQPYDLTHSFFGIPCGFLSLLLRWQYKLPYIVSLRGSDVPGYSERFTWVYTCLTPLIRLIWKQADFVVTNSKGLTELAQKAASKQKFLKIPNGVDTAYYKPQSRSVEEKSKEFHILCAARLTLRKGFRYAVEALALLHKKHPHVRLVIAGGDGNALELLQKQVTECNLKDIITLTGHYTKSDAPKLYQNADVFVMPSLNEGMSNNLLEALSTGLPVLMTPTGGAEELVKDGENGFLIQMQNAEDITKKLTLLIKNPAKCLQFGQESRKLAEQMSWHSVAQKYIGLYAKTSRK